MRDRDNDIMKHIVKYCKQIKETLDNYGNEKDEFFANHIFRNAVSMCIFQIGELANHLTEDFTENTKSEIPWYQVRGMRNRFGHGYGDMDIVRIWETAVADIPILEMVCAKNIK